MKTRKIRGGLFGTETKKQIECLTKLIYDNFFDNFEIEQKKYFNNTFLGYLQSEKNIYWWNKLKRKKSLFEETRDTLLDILLNLIIHYKSDYFNELNELIKEIMEKNNNGSYYKKFNKDNGTTYRNNYNLLDKEFCNNSDVFSMRVQEANKIFGVKHDKDSYSVGHSPENDSIPDYEPNIHVDTGKQRPLIIPGDEDIPEVYETNSIDAEGSGRRKQIKSKRKKRYIKKRISSLKRRKN